MSQKHVISPKATFSSISTAQKHNCKRANDWEIKTDSEAKHVLCNSVFRPCCILHFASKDPSIHPCLVPKNLTPVCIGTAFCRTQYSEYIAIDPIYSASPPHPPCLRSHQIQQVRRVTNWIVFYTHLPILPGGESLTKENVRLKLLSLLYNMHKWKL